MDMSSLTLMISWSQAPETLLKQFSAPLRPSGHAQTVSAHIRTTRLPFVQPGLPSCLMAGTSWTKHHIQATLWNATRLSIQASNPFLLMSVFSRTQSKSHKRRQPILLCKKCFRLLRPWMQWLSLPSQLLEKCCGCLVARGWMWLTQLADAAR